MHNYNTEKIILKGIVKMKSFSFVDSDNLNQELNAALAVAGALHDLPSKVSAIKKFHKKLKTQPQVAFESLVSDIRKKVPLASKVDITPLATLLTGLDERIAEIRQHQLIGFLPDGATSTTRWQYRYALLIGYLNDWKEKQKDCEDATVKDYVAHIVKTLEPFHSEDYPILSWINDNEFQQEQTYNSLYQTAVNQNILKNYDVHEDYKQRVEKQNRDKVQAEQDYKLGLARFELLLTTLNSAQILNDGNELITTIVVAGNQLCDQFKRDMNPFDHATAAELLTHENCMLENLMKVLQADITPAKRNAYFKEAEKAAMQVGVLFDNKIKILDDNFPSQQFENYMGTALIITGAVMLFLAIAALTAVSSGSFLGLTFVASQMVTLSHGAVSMLTGTAVGCLLGGIFGAFAAIGTAISGMVVLSERAENRPKKHAEDFKQKTDDLNVDFKKAIKQSEFYGRFFAIPEEQKEGQPGVASVHALSVGGQSEANDKSMDENMAGEGEVFQPGLALKDSLRAVM
jgi:hypothetical protein